METWKQELYANELYHYGVKGMRWRNRKNRRKDLSNYDLSTRPTGPHYNYRRIKKLHWYKNLDLPSKPKRASKSSAMTKLGWGANRKCSSLRRSREGAIGRAACKKIVDAVGHERLKGRYLYL